MAEVIKTIEQIEDIFRLVVLSILKLDPQAEENQKRVRFPWGSNLSKSGNGSSPAWKKDEDVCVIYTRPQDDFYNRQRNRSYADMGGRDLLAVDEHTDIHCINFVNYGPNAYECARDIRDGLFTYNIRRLLKQNNFSLVTDVSAIRRVPEIYNAEWWNRVDFSATFNEYVRRESEMNVIEEISVSVPAYLSNGEEVTQGAVVKKGL